MVKSSKKILFLVIKNNDAWKSLYITIFVVSKKLEYGSRAVQKSNYQKQRKVWRSRFEMVLSWQNWQNLLRQMLNSEYLTKNWIISTNTDSTSVTQIILMLLDGVWKKLRKFLTHLTVAVQSVHIYVVVQNKKSYRQFSIQKQQISMIWKTCPDYVIVFMLYQCICSNWVWLLKFTI